MGKLLNQFKIRLEVSVRSIKKLKKIQNMIRFVNYYHYYYFTFTLTKLELRFYKLYIHGLYTLVQSTAPINITEQILTAKVI